MTTEQKTIIKVSGFGETRFMEATMTSRGEFCVYGFAAKLGRGGKIHGCKYYFTAGNVNAEGAYVAVPKTTTVLNRTGSIIGFWNNAKHNQYASNHINYRPQEENNVDAAA